MLFLTPGAIQKILLGRKTVTRRPAVEGKPCRYQVGRIYAVQPGRGKPAVTRIRVVAVLKEPWVGFWALGFMDKEARREGFDTWTLFEEAYVAMNGKAALRGPCWRIKFELVEEAPTGRQE